MFKYIDNKTEWSVEATIKTLATKEDIARVIANTKDDIANVKDDIAKVKYDLGKEISEVKSDISESKADTIKWMFIFWIGQVAAMLALVFLFIKK
jgi:hypothetical protein